MGSMIQTGSSVDPNGPDDLDGPYDQNGSDDLEWPDDSDGADYPDMTNDLTGPTIHTGLTT